MDKAQGGRKAGTGRDGRLASALRDNLRRRKAASRHEASRPEASRPEASRPAVEPGAEEAEAESAGERCENDALAEKKDGLAGRD